MANWNDIRFVELSDLGNYVIVVRHDPTCEQNAVRAEGTEEVSERRDKRDNYTLLITGTGNGLATFSSPSFHQVNQPDSDGTINNPLFGSVYTDGRQVTPSGSDGQPTTRQWRNGVIEKTEMVDGVPTTTRYLGGRERQPKITITVHPYGPAILVDGSRMPYSD